MAYNKNVWFAHTISVILLLSKCNSVFVIYSQKVTYSKVSLTFENENYFHLSRIWNSNMLTSSPVKLQLYGIIETMFLWKCKQQHSNSECCIGLKKLGVHWWTDEEFHVPIHKSSETLGWYYYYYYLFNLYPAYLLVVDYSRRPTTEIKYNNIKQHNNN